MKRLSAIVVALATLSLLFWALKFWCGSATHGNLAANKTTTRFPKKIWQTWLGSKQLGEEPLRLARTWIEKNPGYGYEMLTDGTAREYISRTFPDKSLLRLWDDIDDYILLADLIRYLVLLGDGGLYTDIDTDCTQPIANWVPDQDEVSVDLVVGLEYDSLGEPRSDMMNDTVRICSWAMMAKAGSRHVGDVVDKVVSNLRNSMRERQKDARSSYDVDEVITLTGPRVSC